MQYVRTFSVQAPPLTECDITPLTPMSTNPRVANTAVSTDQQMSHRNIVDVLQAVRTRIVDNRPHGVTKRCATMLDCCLASALH
jgi:hypothetical protein